MDFLASRSSLILAFAVTACSTTSELGEIPEGGDSTTDSLPSTGTSSSDGAPVAMAGTETGLPGSDAGTTEAGTTEGGTTEGGTTEAGTTEAGTTVFGDTTAGDTDGTPSMCAPTDVFTCTAALDCDAYDCGSPFEAFDANGCPRPSCELGCGEDEVCFRPEDYGQCTPRGGWACEDDEGECACEAPRDCGGSYCLPVDEVPPPEALPCAHEETDACCCFYKEERIEYYYDFSSNVPEIVTVTVNGCDSTALCPELLLDQCPFDDDSACFYAEDRQVRLHEDVDPGAVACVLEALGGAVLGHVSYSTRLVDDPWGHDTMLYLLGDGTAFSRVHTYDDISDGSTRYDTVALREPAYYQACAAETDLTAQLACIMDFGALDHVCE